MARGSQKPEFGTRLARLRKAAGFTQVTFAEAVGLSPRMVAYWEAQAPRPPPSDQLAAMAQVLGVRTDVLLGLAKPAPSKVVRRPLLRYLELIERLPPGTRREVLRMLRGLAREHGIEFDDADSAAPAEMATPPADFLRVRRGSARGSKRRKRSKPARRKTRGKR